jgi:uncharacterized protein (TIGR02284 family)
MAEVTSEIVTTLNGLITTCKDGEKGFREAAEAVEDAHMKELFNELSAQRAGFVQELQTEVARLGGDPEDDGSPLGALHRGWINLRDSLSSHDESAVLDECERGEDTAVDAYRDAAAQTLPTDVQEMVRRQYTAIQVAHDRVRSLRNAARADLI